MKFLNNIDLNKNQTLNRVAQNLASAPSSPVKGQEYFDTTNNALYIWNGTAWIPTDATKATSIPNSALATNPLDRANHTGTQTASTISNFDTQVRTSRLDQMAAPTAAVAMNSQKITGLATPTQAGDAAEYSWVQSQVQAASAGIDSKPSCRAIATSNITLSGTQTIDGISVIAGNRVLVVGQSTATQNGSYIVAAGAWSRTTDDITPQAFWFIEEGTTYGGSQWKTSTTGTITLGSTALSIVQFGGGSSYTNGNGLNLTGNTFSVKQSTGIVVDTNGVSVDATVVCKKFSQNVGDGSATSIVITHNLNTQDITVAVREVSTQAGVLVDWAATTVNTCTLTFSTAPTASQYRVTIHG
jgi:hypothetical protein